MNTWVSNSLYPLWEYIHKGFPPSPLTKYEVKYQQFF